MALRATPTIAICLSAGIAAGIALARPGDQPDPAASTPVTQPTADVGDQNTDPDLDSPYLDDGTSAPTVDDDGAAPAAAPAAISIEGFAFSSSDPVAAGAPIAVTNVDGADHTLTARDGEFDTGTLGQGQTVSFTAPATPGTYEFFCVIHPSMTAELVVS